LKVVEGGYPFYGELELEPDRPLDELLAGDGVVAAPELLERLGLAVGDPLRLGGVEARVAGVVRSEPDRLGGAFGFSAGPRLFAGPELFERTGLETVGSRIRYRALVALPPGAPRETARRWAERLRTVVPAEVFDVETWTEAQPALRAGLSRAERFLGLVALLSLLVGGIGVGQTVRAWLAGRLDAVAVLKCIGLRPREIALVYAGQVALLGLAGSLIGAGAGVALQLAVPRFASTIVPPGLIDPFQPGAIVRGVALGLGVALLFGLPSLSAVLRVAPARVLRRAVEPLPAPRGVAAATVAAVVGGVWATAAAQSGSAVLGAQFTVGALAAAGLLALAAWGVSRLAGALPRTRATVAGRFWLRHGLAALARPGAATLAAVVALGLGVMVVVGLWLVERRLTDELVGNLPEEAPSVFLVDIQPDQWEGVRRILQEEGAARIDSVPVVMARLSAVDGVDVREMAPTRRDAEGSREEGERRWALTREQRLTYLEELPEDNRIVAGAPWSVPDADPDLAEVSVEEEFARELGVGVGSTLVFDVQGVPVRLTVTSLRTVDWSTFGINFFLVVEPGVLDRAPQHRIAAVQAPPGAETRLQDRIAAAFPNVTVLRVREILDKVVTTLRRIADGVRFVGAFTVLAGVAILAGAVSAGAVRRRREVALLKTLGTTRAGVVAVYAVEYALIGLVAGAIGCGGAAVLARTVLVRGMEVPWVLEPLPLLAALGAAVALTVIAGLAASAKALQSRPMEIIRN
jgi:putative ABC transport system permease protein